MSHVEKQHNIFHVMGMIFHDARHYMDKQFKQYNLTRNEWLVLAMVRNYP